MNLNEMTLEGDSLVFEDVNEPYGLAQRLGILVCQLQKAYDTLHVIWKSWSTRNITEWHVYEAEYLCNLNAQVLRVISSIPPEKRFQEYTLWEKWCKEHIQYFSQISNQAWACYTKSVAIKGEFDISEFDLVHQFVGSTRFLSQRQQYKEGVASTPDFGLCSPYVMELTNVEVNYHTYLRHYGKYNVSRMIAALGLVWLGKYFSQISMPEYQWVMSSMQWIGLIWFAGCVMARFREWKVFRIWDKHGQVVTKMPSTVRYELVRMHTAVSALGHLQLLRDFSKSIYKDAMSKHILTFRDMLAYHSYHGRSHPIRNDFKFLSYMEVQLDFWNLTHDIL